MFLRRRRNNEIVGSYLLDFKKCTDEDFIKRGLQRDKIIKFDAKFMKICPDFDSYPELTSVLNGYNNPNRDDLSIMITNCQQHRLPYGQKCHSEQKAKQFLDQTYITVNTLVKVVDLSNEVGNSLSTRDVFHSQVQLDNKKYFDNNNFIRIN